MKRFAVHCRGFPGLADPDRWCIAADSPLEILAARQELEEFIRSTSTRLRDLEESMQVQQKRIMTLEDENKDFGLSLRA